MKGGRGGKVGGGGRGGVSGNEEMEKWNMTETGRE